MIKTKAQKTAFAITSVVFLAALTTFAFNLKKLNKFASWQPKSDISFKIKVQEVTANNGIKAWLVEDKTTPIVAISIIFKGGSSLDDDSQNGLTTMVAALLSEGAGEFNSEEFNKILEQKAIRLSFNGDFKSFTASVETPFNQVETAFKMLTLALTKPRFDNEPIARIKDVLKTALNQRMQSPSYVAEWEWRKQAFPNTPYARQMPADIKSIENITKKDLQNYVKTRFAKDNLFIGVAGAINERMLQNLLNDYLKNLSPKSELLDLPFATINEFDSPKVVTMPIPQSIGVFGHQGISRNDPDFYAAYVMNYILGEGSFSSRLMDEVRSKQGLAYNIDTSLLASKENPLIKGRVATSNNDFAKTMDIIIAEWQKMRDFGITDSELKNAKDFLISSFPLRFNSSITIASMLSYIQLENLGIDYLDLRNSYFAIVTKEQVNQVAKRLLTPKPLFAVSGNPVLTKNE